MGGFFTRISYSGHLGSQERNTIENYRSGSAKCRNQVSSCNAKSLLSAIPTPAQVARKLIRTCSSSLILGSPSVTLAGHTYFSRLRRGNSLLRLLLGTCCAFFVGLLVLLWLVSRHWQAPQSSHAPCANSIKPTDDERSETDSNCTLDKGSHSLRHFAFLWGEENTPHHSSSLRSDELISSDQKNGVAVVRQKDECDKRPFEETRSEVLSRTRSVWFLLSRRKYGRIPRFSDKTPVTHPSCHLPTAERQLSQRKSAGNLLLDLFSGAAVSSITPPRHPVAFPPVSPAVPTEIHAPVSLQDLARHFSAYPSQALNSGKNVDAASVRSIKGNGEGGKGTLASLFDLWQQLEPLTFEMKEFLVRHLTEKAVSHILWLYDWQKEHAVPLLLRSLLQRSGDAEQQDGSYETQGVDTMYLEDAEHGPENDDDDTDDADDDDYVDDDGKSHNEESFSNKHLAGAVANTHPMEIRSHYARTDGIRVEFSKRNIPWNLSSHDESVPRSATRRTDPAYADTNLFTGAKGVEESPYHNQDTEKDISADDEPFSVIEGLESTYKLGEFAGEDFITPESPWIPDVEIEQEYIMGSTSLLGDTLSAIVTKSIPNITNTVNRLNHHVGVYLQHYKDAVWSLPLQQIVNATLNGGMFPPLVPLQNASFPDYKRDVKCNPGVQVCQNLAYFLRATGGLLRRVYHSTYPYNIHNRAEKAADILNAAVVGQRVTATFYSVAEQIVTAAMLETVLNATTSLIEIPADSQVFQLINALLSLVGDVYSLADLPAEVAETYHAPRALQVARLRLFHRQRVHILDPQLQQQKLLLPMVKNLASKVRTAFYCRLFNGRLPYCDQSPISLTLPPRIPEEVVFDPYTGFVKFLFFVGFEEACNQRGGCFSDVFIDGRNFDGFYQLVAVGSTGFPVYQGFRHFRRFLGVDRLFFWQGARASVVDASQGSWAGITTLPETYYASTKGQLLPFASLATLTPPANCSAYPPEPFGNPDTNFPLCLSPSDLWVVGRVAAFGNCNGFLYSHVCVFPASVTIIPTPSPAVWTFLTSTSTATPPAVPRIPPGGGVPPGGTTGGGGTQTTTGSPSEEEVRSETHSKVEYIFWDGGESPFDTSYPWERQNLISAWTAKRRKIQQKPVRNRPLLGTGPAVSPPRTNRKMHIEAGLREVELGRETSMNISDRKQRSLSTPTHEGPEDKDAVPDRRESSASAASLETARGRYSSRHRDVKMIASATGTDSLTNTEVELLHGEGTKKIVARMLEGLNGLNGRRFQSSIPVHRSQFVDGFSGTVDAYIPPFFPFPPDLL